MASTQIFQLLLFLLFLKLSLNTPARRERTHQYLKKIIISIGSNSSLSGLAWKKSLSTQSGKKSQASFKETNMDTRMH